MIKKFMKNGFVSFMCFMLMMVFATAIVYAKAETVNTYYSFACSTTSRSHEASSTPTVTVTTSNMIGNPSDKLWVEVEKNIGMDGQHQEVTTHQSKCQVYMEVNFH